MLSLLHTIFILPIEAALGLAFRLFLAWGGSAGAAALLLSAAVTLCTLPLYYLAERWKRRDDEIKARMARDLRSIKAHYAGQKRFYLVRAAHRLYGYGAGYQLKASFGLFVQIPFFLAAFGLLSRHPAMAGASFWFIADLGRPDGLLGGANALPLAMTAFNLASTLAYTRSFRLKDNAQPAFLALLFLALLYDSPAGLLLYWTSNNALSLIKNAFFPAPKAARAADEDEGPGALRTAAGFLRGLYGGLGRPAAQAALALAVAAQGYWLINHKHSFELCVLAAAVAAAALGLWAALRQLKARGLRAAARALAPTAMAWLGFLPLAYVLVFLRRQNAWVSNENVKFMAALWLDLCAWLAYRAGARASGPAPAALGRLSEREAAFLAFGALAGLAAEFLLLYPLAVYYSSPQDVGMGAAALLVANAPAFLGLVAAAAALSWAALRLGRSRGLGAAALAVALGAAAFSALDGGRYGILDEFALERASLLDSYSPARAALDAGLAWLAVLAGRYLLAKRRSWAWAAMALPLALGAAQAGGAAASAAPAAAAFAAPGAARADGEAASPPLGAAEAHAFSLEEANTVYLIADMFNGNYLGRALADDPGLAGRLDGFTWYRNAVSAGSHTALSLPALYGGPDYAPERLRSRARPGQEELNEAAAAFFSAAQAGGRRAAAIDALYADPARHGAATLRSADFAPYWRAEKAAGGAAAAGPGRNRKPELLALLAAFKAAPGWLKPRLYDGGSWIAFRRSYQFDYIARKTAENYGYLDLLPALSSVRGGPGLFLLIHTQFPHEPYGVRADGSIIDGDFPDPETRSFVDAKAAYYSAKRFLYFLADWVERLRELGAYDNTRFVVLADHGNNVDDHGIALAPALDNPLDRARLSRASVLLMHKPPLARGPLATDLRLASNADGPGLLKDIKPPADREYLRYDSLLSAWREFLGGGSWRAAAYRLGLGPEGGLRAEGLER